MKTLIRKIIQQFRKIAARATGAELGKDCVLQRNVIFRRGVHEGKPGNIRFGSRCTLSDGTLFHSWGGSIAVADDVFIGPYTVIYGHGGVSIGSDTLIAEHCSILSSNHAIPGEDRKIRWEPDQRVQTTIGADVWLGAGVRILAGVTIGDGCVIGAGAVVTKDLPAYSVAIGVPAKVVRSRKSADTKDIQS